MNEFDAELDIQERPAESNGGFLKASG